MTTTATSTALATIQPAFTDPERLALAGYLAGYRGLTREAYTLDLRQFTTWCRARSLALFVRRRWMPVAAIALSRPSPLKSGGQAPERLICAAVIHVVGTLRRTPNRQI